MIIFDGKHVTLDLHAYVRLLKERLPDTSTHEEKLKKATLSKETFDRYLRAAKSSGDYTKNITLETALQLCNLLDCRPCELLRTNGALVHREWGAIEPPKAMQGSLPPAFSEHVDDFLQACCADLVSEDCSQESLLTVIESVASYLESTVGKYAATRKYSRPVVDAFVLAIENAALSSAIFSYGSTWSDLSFALTKLMSVNSVSGFAESELNQIMVQLSEARLDSTLPKKEIALKRTAYWLQSNWNLIYETSDAYSALSYLMSLFDYYYPDHATRTQLVNAINYFCIYEEYCCRL